jgi:hypothetical protein
MHLGAASYAARIEKAIEATADPWERAEWDAGPPKMTREQHVADLADRLTSDQRHRGGGGLAA